MLINFVTIIVFLLRFLSGTFSKVRIKTKNNINIWISISSLIFLSNRNETVSKQ